MKIESGKYVALAYDLYSGEMDENGKPELMEQASADKPFSFVSGLQQVLTSFEKQLLGKEMGEKFDFTLTPDEAYGEYEDTRVVDVPRNVFEIDGVFDDKVVYESAVLPMMDSEGNHMYGSVTAVKEDVVTMDFNHPFAGEMLHFVGTVVEVRDATEEELNPHHGCGNCGGGCNGGAEGDCCGNCGESCH